MTRTTARHTEPAAFWWREGKDKDPSDRRNRTERRWTVIGPSNFRENDDRRRTRNLYRHVPPDWSEDLFRLASAAFLADKHISRSRAADNWSRSLLVSVPVFDADRWSDSVRRSLALLLETLTGDRWEILCRPAHFDTERSIDEESRPPAEVTLFSGGLDSLCWAARRARKRSDKELLLVQFDEPNLPKVQTTVLDAVAALTAVSGRAVRRVRHSQLIQRSSGSDDERSSRTRGFLYAAAAIRAAAAEGSECVTIPENGQIALNPPLNASRAGACSTRSVHPWTLWQLNGLIAELGGHVRVWNPFALHTKGEVCRKGIKADLRPEDLRQTLSCGYSPRRWPRDHEQNNCGFCFPCLLRRSGLHAVDSDAAEGPDPDDYAFSPWNEPVGSKHTADWRALRRWIGGPELKTRDLIADMPFPPGTDLQQLVALVNRGRTEVRSWMAAVKA